MGYRGRLIFPFIAVIYRLDTKATDEAGYDSTFRTPQKSVPDPNLGVSKSTRREMEPIELSCQIQPLFKWREQQMAASGNVPESQLVLVFHMEELEDKGLVDKDGNPMVRVNDRLDRILNYRTGKIEQVVRGAASLFATEVRPAAYGIGGGRNLLFVSWNDRPQGKLS